MKDKRNGNIRDLRINPTVPYLNNRSFRKRRKKTERRPITKNKSKSISQKFSFIQHGAPKKIP
jgi:hypothetical protein